MLRPLVLLLGLAALLAVTAPAHSGGQALASASGARPNGPDHIVVTDAVPAPFGRWLAFEWRSEGETVGPFSYASTARVAVSVTDDFCRGDRFDVLVDGDRRGRTSASIDQRCDAGEPNPDGTFRGGRYSSGMFLLPAGQHEVSLVVSNSPTGFGVAFFRLDGCTAALTTPGLLTGTPADDVLCGSRGDDRLVGVGGDDRVLGGGGIDQLLGGGTVVAPGTGDDALAGGPGDDFPTGGDGRDRLLGGQADDTLTGGPGADGLSSDGGGDVLIGEEGDDVLVGEQATDSMSGGGGNDYLFGGPANDFLSGSDFGGADTDTCDGGAGTGDVATRCEDVRRVP